MPEHGERDEGREPEEHGQRVEGEHGEGVRDGGEEARGEGEVEQDEERPDGDEYHEAILGGTEAVGCDWGREC